MLVIKRNGDVTEFEINKIEKAILKAMKYGSGITNIEVAQEIAEIVRILFEDGPKIPTVEQIEEIVYYELLNKGETETAKAYEGYRKVREFQRKRNLVDNKILGIINGTDKEAINENSNKDAYIASTQRDLIAGEVSKDLCRRTKLPANIVHAHDEGIIHFHDMDYYIQQIFNCDLVNLKNMLGEGTVINKKMIETPKSFMTACTVATQIVQQIANGQYGGQTISLSHLAPYVRVSKNKLLKEAREEHEEINLEITEKQIEYIANKRLRKEIAAGIQTIQFQINTFSTSNGQAPFLSIFMYLDEEPEYREEMAMLIEEMFKQRILGMKNEVGVYVTPSFPKLLYVLDENNIHHASKYRYLTNLAIKCVAKRMMPDFISAKKMKENYNGQVFPCMGCRSFLSPWIDENGNYKWYGRFNQGVVTLNLADVGLSANNDLSRFWKILEERENLCKEALMLRHEALKGTPSDVSPIHWQHGGIARLKKGEKIDKYLYDGYSTISLGYIGLYECVFALIGESNTTEEGKKLALEILNHLRDKCELWKKETGLGFGLYGSPSESTTYKFAKALRKKFGIIEGITDKDYLTNSYHVNVKEAIDPFEKLEFESQFQKISSGGAVSYVEVSNLTDNLDALAVLVEYMYETIQYAEINTKSDYCHDCGFDGEILLDENYEWYCPNCGNRNHNRMSVCRRTCGYLGDNFWNHGRTQDIGDRYIHLDNHLLEGDN